MTAFNKKHKAFSLPEVIVTMFIFVLIMLVVTSVFVVMVKTRKDAREMQRNMENIRYAVELMAKSIRTSNVDGFSENDIFIYDYSQEECIHFEFAGNKLKMYEVPGDRKSLTLADCSLASYADPTELALQGIDSIKFYYISPGGTSSLGRVTISMVMEGGQESAQTTVALRNYSEIEK